MSPLLNRHYLGTRPSQRSKPVEPFGQEAFYQRFRIVHAARPHLGMRVADIGAGSGFFAVLFARAVGPEGRVYAIDASESFVPAIRELARRYRVDNVIPIVNAQQSTGLEAGSIDLAFLNDTYRRLANPRTMLDSIYQALVPYGILILIDDRPAAGLGPVRPPGRPPLDRDETIAEVEDAGFRLVQELDFLHDSHFLRFEKVGDEPDMEVGPIETLPADANP